MGVALQFFLCSCPPGRDVYGVELAPSRYALANLALQRVAETDSSRYHYESLGDGAAKLRDLELGCCCDIVCGSLLDTPRELLASASAICMEVCLPKEVQVLACQMLQQCETSCRVVCYAPLHGLAEKCRLAPVRAAAPEENTADLGDGNGGLCLPASWKPE